MALVDIGNIGSANVLPITNFTALSNLDDNKVVKNFYPLVIGKAVVADPLALQNDSYRTLPSYVYWS